MAYNGKELFEILKKQMAEKVLVISKTEIAKMVGVSGAAVTKWFRDEYIPLDRSHFFFSLLGLEVSKVKEILGIPSISKKYRIINKFEKVCDVSASDLDDHDLDERIEGIINTLDEDELTASQRTQIKIDSSDDTKIIASKIRTFLGVDNDQRLKIDILNNSCGRLGVKLFILPRLNGIFESDYKPVAANCKIRESNVIILDGERRVDKAYFNFMHEFVHLFLDDTVAESRCKSDEDYEAMIDEVATLLIVPPLFIKKQLSGLKGDDLIDKTIDILKEDKFLSPKLLERAIKMSSVASKVEVLRDEFDHLEKLYKKHFDGLNIFKLRHVNVDWEDIFALADFFIDNVLGNKSTYPIFYNTLVKIKDGELSRDHFKNIFPISSTDSEMLFDLVTTRAKSETPYKL